MVSCELKWAIAENSFLANPEKICYKLIFLLMRNIDEVVYHVKISLSSEVRE